MTCIFVGLASATQAATFVVDRAVDADFSACTPAPGDCSLRGAINRANANAGADTIAFNLPGAGYKSITPTFALPILSDAGTFIDGNSQPGYVNAPLVTINGGSLPAEALTKGINITTSNCRVRSLNLQGWDTAIEMSGAGAHSNRIEGCFIGTDATGLATPLPLMVSASQFWRVLMTTSSAALFATSFPATLNEAS